MSIDVAIQTPIISVIDSPCGGGKSVSLHDWLDKEIRRHKVDEAPFQFLFLVPLLTEVERLRDFLIEHEHIITNKVNSKNEKIPYQTFIPLGGTIDNPIPKISESVKALKAGMSAIISHALFLENPKTFCNLIVEHNILLIIDETLTMFTHHKIFTKDFDHYIKDETILWDSETYLLSLNKNVKGLTKDNTQFFDLFKRINKSSIYYYKGSPVKKDDEEEIDVDVDRAQKNIADQSGKGTCIEIFPIEHFMKLPHIIISTYLFEGDPMKIYLDMCNAPYQYFHVEDKGDMQDGKKVELKDRYVLKEGVPPASGKDFQNLITIYEPKKLKKKTKDPKINYNDYSFYEDIYRSDKLFNSLSYNKSRELLLSNKETRMIEESNMLYYFKKDVKDKLFTREEYDKVIEEGLYEHASHIYNMPQNREFWFEFVTLAEKPNTLPASYYMVSDLCDSLKIPINDLINKIENTSYLAKQVRNFLDKLIVDDKLVQTEDILWTSFKDQSWGLETDKTIVRDSYIKVTKKKNSTNFCQSSIRATNDFKDTSVLVFLINKYWNRFIYRAISLINKNMLALDKKIVFNDIEGSERKIELPTIDDMYGLSVLIQWMFRSRIRKSPRESIKIFIPSKRMRDLLYRWLEGEFDTAVIVKQREKSKLVQQALLDSLKPEEEAEEEVDTTVDE